MYNRMQYLDVPYFKQDTTYTCGPASLQMVFAYYGIRVSEEKLAQELGSASEDGTRNGALIDAVLRRGLHCYVNDDATLEELMSLLERELPTVVNYIEPSQEDGHYGVVIGVSEEHVVLHDPWNGEGLEFSHDAFLTRWKSRYADHHRWLMAVSTEALPLGKQYHP